MMGRTHEAATLTAWFGAVAIGQHVGLHPQILPVIGGAFFAYTTARVPDIDNPDSRVGHAFPRTAKALYRLSGHRGITHWALTAVAVGVATGLLPYLVSPRMWWVGVSVGGSWLLHILCDCLTWDGVVMFAPFSDTRVRPHYRRRIECGGKVENLVLFPVFTIAAIATTAVTILTAINII